MRYGACEQHEGGEVGERTGRGGRRGGGDVREGEM